MKRTNSHRASGQGMFLPLFLPPSLPPTVSSMSTAVMRCGRLAERVMGLSLSHSLTLSLSLSLSLTHTHTHTHTHTLSLPCTTHQKK